MSRSGASCRGGGGRVAWDRMAGWSPDRSIAWIARTSGCALCRHTCKECRLSPRQAEQRQSLQDADRARRVQPPGSGRRSPHQDDRRRCSGDSSIGLFLRHGKPEHLSAVTTGRSSPLKRSRPGFSVSVWTPSGSTPGSPWENGYNERFNGTLRREVLNAEWFATTRQAQIVINSWLRQYNHTRLHQALNMRPPVPETLRRNGPETLGARQHRALVNAAPPPTSAKSPL